VEIAQVGPALAALEGFRLGCPSAFPGLALLWVGLGWVGSGCGWVVVGLGWAGEDPYRHRHRHLCFAPSLLGAALWCGCFV
jgi:hypothetical protein